MKKTLLILAVVSVFLIAAGNTPITNGKLGGMFDAANNAIVNIFNQTPNEVWISAQRTDSKGKGSQGDPFDGHTQAAFDALFTNTAKIPASAVVINLGNGTFTTNGILVKEGWKIRGRGKFLTTIKLNDSQAVVDGSVSTVLHRFDFEGFLNNAEVSDLTIDLNRANQPAAATARSFDDLTTTNASATATSLQANFTSADLHKAIRHRSIPSNTYIGVINSATSIGLSSSSSSNVPVNATGSITSSASIDGLNSNLNGACIAAKSAKIMNVRVLGAYAVPGEGFPLSINHDGTKSNSDFAEIGGCDVIDPYGYMTAIMIFDQSTTRTVANAVTTINTTTFTSATLALTANDVRRTISTTNFPAGTIITAINSATSGTASNKATASGSSQTLSILKGEVAGSIHDCFVYVSTNASSGSQAFGGRQWNHFSIKNNIAIGAQTGMTCDTDDFADVDVAGNKFLTNPQADLSGGQGILYNGAGAYSNWRIHDNTITTSATGGPAIVISAGTFQVYNNTLIAGNTSYAAAGFGTATGTFYNNTITETPATTIPVGVKAWGNLTPAGVPKYAAISGKPQMFRADGGSNSAQADNTGARTVFDYTDIRVDPASMGNASTDRITAPAAGQMNVKFNCNFATVSASGSIQVEISKNGSPVIFTQVSGALAGTGYTVDFNDTCVSGDYYQGTVFNNTGTNGTIDRNYQKTTLSAEFIAD